MPAGLRPSPPDHFSAYKERHANGALKIRLATMASHKARDGLSPRAQARSCAAARSKLIVRSCDRPPRVTNLTHDKTCGLFLDRPGCGKRRAGIKQKLISHIGESSNFSRPAHTGVGSHGCSQIPRKGRPSACELPEACHGIIRVGCSLQTWPSAASVRQKNSNCKIFRRKRTALQLRVIGNNYSPLCELVSSLSGSEILILSRLCSRPASTMLDCFGRCALQFLLRKVKNRTVGQPSGVAFAALGHRDDILGEDAAASG